jgi:molybdenum cofactor sulfurtransferase
MPGWWRGDPQQKEAQHDVAASTATRNETPVDQRRGAAVITAKDLDPAVTLTGKAAMAAALRDFEQRYPAYAGTAVLDDMRARDYTQLDATGHIYLDYTGGGLYADSQLARHQELLAGAVFGNPHSQNVPSQEATAQVEATRAQILEFFRASPGEYEVIFTPNATGALRLVGESYPFGPGGRYLLTFDNHNSVNGIRQFARAKGASVTYLPLTPADLRVSQEALARHLQAATSVRRRRFGRRRSGSAARNLFAFPAQSNFSGVQHPLAWIAQAQAAGYDVLLDAAAFAPTNRLDLSRWHPDYVSLSFYKIFGYPTGIGALLVRRPALAKLHRPWYAGGTITFSSVRAEASPGGGFYQTPGPAGFEDGTVDYLGIPAVGIGLDHISSVGVETVHTRVMCLTGWLLEALSALRHSNGAPVVRIYGPAGTDRRGATIAMNFFDPSDVLIDSVRVERRANRAAISLRSGCHCNPGVRETTLGFSTQEMAAAFKDKDRLRYEEFLQVIDGKTTGAARASIGLVTTFADVYRFWEFAGGFRDVPSDAVGA